MKISQSHPGRKAARYVQGGLPNENIFTGARSLVIFCKCSQATCLSSILILSETTCSGGRCPKESGTQVWEAGCFDPLFGDRTNADSRYVWTWLNLGHHCPRTACPGSKLFTYIESRLAWQWKNGTLNMPYQIPTGWKSGSKCRALGRMLGTVHTRALGISAVASRLPEGSLKGLLTGWEGPGPSELSEHLLCAPP